MLSIVLALLVSAGVLAALTAEAPARDTGDSTTVHNFKVEIDGVIVGGFREVSGLTCETEIIEFTDGDIITRIPGRTQCGPIVFKYGSGLNRDLWDWYRATMEFRPEFKDGAVVLLNSRGDEVRRYNFFEAFPVKWTGPTLDSSSNDIAVETLELSVGRIDLPD